MKQAHTDRPHAEFSPSALKYIDACAGWESRGGTCEAAEKGTRIHEAVEHRDPSGLLNEEEQGIYDQLVESEERWLATIFPDNDSIVEHREVKLDIPLPYGCETFGTSDLVAVGGNVALVLDHKTGIGHIDEVDDNHQSKAYAIGVFELFPEVDTIHAVFLVPQREQELHGVYTRDMLSDMADRLARAILLAKTVRPKWFLSQPALEELNPNNACQYCKFADQCPALGHIAHAIAARYEPDWIPDGPVRSTEVDDPDTLGQLYTIAVIMEKWAEGIKRKAVLSGLDGAPPTGYRLRSMGCTRSIADPVEFLGVAERELGLDASELMQFATFPLGAVSKYYESKAPKGKKAEFQRRLEGTLEAHSIISRSAERFSLARE